MNGVYLITGGNLGNRVENMRQSLLEIEKRIGKIMAVSQLYETASWGKENESDYLNQVVLVETGHQASDILQICLDIEHKLGRTRKEKWESRLIDIDILFLNDEIIHLPDLMIPHPEIQNRRFVLVPMNEIAPEFIHPIFKKSIKELLNACTDKLEVHRYTT